MNQNNEPQAQFEMPKWKCHKQVHAFKIGKIEGCRIFSADGSMSVEVPPDFITKHPLNQDGYYVVYADGYASYSPAKPFEDGYTRVA